MKRKIAILGGGIGGLAAAWELTRTDALRSQYDVTVYQMGWRLGGKGASGRNQADGKYNRIEEHGLHIWLGNYENAFRLMRECYDEMSSNGLAPGSPFQSWDDAFKKQNLITMMEEVDGNWEPWSITIPPNDNEPGLDHQCISLMGIVKRILELLQGVELAFPRTVATEAGVDAVARPPHDLFRSLYGLTETLSDNDEENSQPQYELLHQKLESFTDLYLHVDHLLSASSTTARRRRILIELALTLAKGTVKDLLLQGKRSFDFVDHHDFRHWLALHGASAEAIDSAPVRCCYEIVFGYRNGDGVADFAAGTAARFVLRWVLTYQGALIYKMQAGMGDIVFSPLYLVLEHRGVEFKFFHRLERLELSGDKSTVARILMDSQVDLTVSKYEPIEVIDDVPCWPSEPRFEGQIDPTQAAAIRQMHLDNPGMEPLESAYSPWNDREGKTTVALESGSDFDDVVLAVPVGALPIHAQELIDANPAFRDMVSNIKTVATQSFQLWLNRDRADLGWTASATILDSYLDSWADFSHLEAVEGFPADSVHSIAYFCKALGDRSVIPEPGPDPSYPVEETDGVKTWSRDKFLNGPTGMRSIWPAAYDSTGFRWSWLADPGGVSGVDSARFDSQFWCANVNPSDRYVQALTDTTKYRLRADESGYDNVVLAGDWTRTGINAGCIEGATIGGMQAARAISGSPAAISGEHDFCPSLFGQNGSGCSGCAGCSGCSGCAGCVGVLLGPIRVFLDRFPTAKKLLCAYLCTEKVPSPASTTTPLFVERGGAQTFPQPYDFLDVDVDAFLVQVDNARIGMMCDKYLNDPSGGHVTYSAIVDRAMLVAARINRCQPTNAPDHEFGWVPEIDVALWVPLLSFNDDIPRLVWFHPYVFVDHPWAVACGREVYGFPKAMSRFEFATDTSDTTLLRVIAPGSEILNPSLEVVDRTVLEVIGGPLAAPSRSWSERERDECFEFLTSNFVSKEKIAMRESLAAADVASLFDFANPEMVFLKQFRGISNGRNACYQAITEASAEVSGFSGGSYYEGMWKLRVPSSVSHPIRDDFGWISVDQPILSGWNFRFSFQMKNGAEIWRA